ncbi:MAG: hypothetical protein MJZ20_08455 [Bacteroidaceae bacterium]|nr:hypothetical protein [Bacteroidaceae bacterium]
MTEGIIIALIGLLSALCVAILKGVFDMRRDDRQHREERACEKEKDREDRRAFENRIVNRIETIEHKVDAIEKKVDKHNGFYDKINLNNLEIAVVKEQIAELKSKNNNG